MDVAVQLANRIIRVVQRTFGSECSINRGKYRWVVVILGCVSTLTGSAFASPNILLIISDDLNTDFSTYGYEKVKSPNLDKLADRGVRFDRAYAQYPTCTPSRTSFLTGLYPDQTEVKSRNKHFRETIPDVKTLPQLFREAGYYTARVGKVFHYDVPKDIGTNGMDDPDSWDERVNPLGIDRQRYEETEYIRPIRQGAINGGVLSWLDIGGTDEQHTDGIVTNSALDLVRKNHPQRTGKPFFLAVGYFRPHVPFAAPRKYFDLYPLEDIELPVINEADRVDIPVVALSDMPQEKSMSVTTRKKLYQAYFASISYVDSEVGRLLAGVDDLGLREDTIVIFMSDHGFMLGEHGLWQKSNLFDKSIRVPMIVSVPGNPANGRSTQSLAELIDIYPTLLEYAGITAPDYLSGHSLKNVIADPAVSVRDSALSQSWSYASKTRSEWHERKIMGYSIRTESFRYTEWAGGIHGVELYDYRSDPMEFNNLIGHAEYVEIQNQLRESLRRRISSAATAAQF